MVLKDFECRECGRTSERMVDSVRTMIAEYCDRCKRTTNSFSICNGGTGKRYRFADWGGVDFSGQTVASAPTATTLDASGNAIVDQHVSGKACQDLPRFSGDVREEKRDRMAHRRAARQGKNKLYFTKGSYANQH